MSSKRNWHVFWDKLTCTVWQCYGFTWSESPSVTHLFCPINLWTLQISKPVVYFSINSQRHCWYSRYTVSFISDDTESQANPHIVILYMKEELDIPLRFRLKLPAVALCSLPEPWNSDTTLHCVEFGSDSHIVMVPSNHNVCRMRVSFDLRKRVNESYFTSNSYINKFIHRNLYSPLYLVYVCMYVSKKDSKKVCMLC